MKPTPVGADSGACKGCGKSIWWINVGTHRIPIDPVPPVYSHDGDGGFFRQPESWVSHFATCSRANDFSGRTRKEAT